MGNMTKPGTSLTDQAFPSCTMNGRIIRSMGIQRFLDNCRAPSFANIDMFASIQRLEQRWHECDMGCHDPGYRVLHRQATYSEMIDVMAKVDPTQGLATGLVDGVATTTGRIAKGVERTADGLGASGTGRIADIGIENSLAFNLAKDALVKAFSLSLNLVDNPFTALIINVITYYIRYVPDEIIVQLAAHGKFKNLDIDVNLAVQANLKGMVNIDLKGFAESELRQIGSYLKNNPQAILKLVGKYQGRKLATYIATHIAITIAKQIAIGLTKSYRYRNILRNTRPGKTTRGLAGVLIFLLKTQGLLQDASNASQRLHNRCPLLWQKLRSAHGLDMIYFMVEDYIHEYVDRVGLAERDPARFVEMVVAILQPPGTVDDLFFPFRKVN